MDALKDTCHIIDSWVNSTDFKDAYIFGSLIHKNGSQFDPQISDVDIICCFEAPESYLSRWKAVMKAVDPVGHMNLQFLKVFGRTDASNPIVSVVPVSGYELQSGIHKDKAPQFFSHNTFHNVRNHAKIPIGKEREPVNAELEGALDAVREAQRYRNKVLAVAPSGARGITSFEGPDVLPKLLARCAAQTRWARESNGATDQRFDVNEGFVYMLQLLTSRRNEAADVDDLLQRVVIRMGGRGKPGALTPSDQLLLWEILAEDAAILVPVQGEVVKRPTRSHLATDIKNRAFARAGYCCSFPGCNVPLGVDGIGQIAHISSLDPAGPRYNPSLSQEALQSLDNLVVLCPTHHRIVDTRPEEYTVEVMRHWNEKPKSKHPIFNADNLFTLVRIIANMIY